MRICIPQASRRRASGSTLPELERGRAPSAGEGCFDGDAAGRSCALWNDWRAPFWRQPRRWYGVLRHVACGRCWKANLLERDDLGPIRWDGGLTSPARGLGVSPLGISAYGFGTPAVAPVPGGKAVPRRRRRSSTAAARSPSRKARSGSTNTTRSDSPSARPTSSTSSRSRRLRSRAPQSSRRSDKSSAEARYATPNLTQEMTAKVNEAFAPLVKQGFIRIDSIVVELQQRRTNGDAREDP